MIKELEYGWVWDEHVYCLRLRSMAQFQLWKKALDSLLGVGRTENDAFLELEQKIDSNQTRLSEDQINAQLTMQSRHIRPRGSPKSARSRSVSVSVAEYPQYQPTQSSISKFLSPITSVFSSNSQS